MEYLTNLLAMVAGDLWTTIVHNWHYVLLSVIVASLVQVYLNPDRLSTWLRRRAWVAVLAAVALGALTPFCSCGTTAVILGALASSVPWAPIVAFMASSPLTSPEEFFMSVGLALEGSEMTTMGASEARKQLPHCWHRSTVTTIIVRITSNVGNRVLISEDWQTTKGEGVGHAGLVDGHQSVRPDRRRRDAPAIARRPGKRSSDVVGRGQSRGVEWPRPCFRPTVGRV